MKSKLIIAAALIVGIGIGATGITLLQAQSSASAVCGQSTPGAESHTIMIMNGKVEPTQITGTLCDSLTITNMDSVAREIAFGPHEHHVPYDGVAEKVLAQGQSLTITLNQAGSFHFHDHLHDEVQGYFTVIK